MKENHVLFGFAQQLGEGAKAIPIVCQHCEEQVLLVLPVGMNTLCSLARWFEDQHCECVLDKKESGA